MQMTGEQHIAAPRQRVWEALNDPEILRQCIPGCQSLERETEDRLAAIAEVKIGPIGARFKGVVQLSDFDAPNGYTITGQGSGGVAGSAKGSAKVRLADDNAGTLVSYDVEAEVGGRMAQLGGPIIDATAKNLAAKFFSRFGEVVGGAALAEAMPVTPLETPEVPAAVPVMPTTAAIQPAALSAPAGFPWGWILVAALAVVTGFLLGRSDAADWWVVAVIVLAIVAAGAGFEAGRRSGGRP